MIGCQSVAYEDRRLGPGCSPIAHELFSGGLILQAQVKRGQLCVASARLPLRGLKIYGE